MFDTSSMLVVLFQRFAILTSAFCGSQTGNHTALPLRELDLHIERQCQSFWAINEWDTAPQVCLYCFIQRKYRQHKPVGHLADVPVHGKCCLWAASEALNWIANNSRVNDNLWVEDRQWCEKLLLAATPSFSSWGGERSILAYVTKAGLRQVNHDARESDIMK